MFFISIATIYVLELTSMSFFYLARHKPNDGIAITAFLPQIYTFKIQNCVFKNQNCICKVFKVQNCTYLRKSQTLTLLRKPKQQQQQPRLYRQHGVCETTKNNNLSLGKRKKTLHYTARIFGSFFCGLFHCSRFYSHCITLLHVLPVM